MLAFVVVHRLINSLDESCDSTDVPQVPRGPALCCSWPKIPIPAAPPSANHLEFAATKDGDLIPTSRTTPGHFHLVVDRRLKPNCGHAVAPWLIDAELRRPLNQKRVFADCGREYCGGTYMEFKLLKRSHRWTQCTPNCLHPDAGTSRHAEHRASRCANRDQDHPPPFVRCRQP
jgi:hypothetical protein